MILTEQRKKQLVELIKNIPDEQWDKLIDTVNQHVPKELEIYTYLQKMYEDNKFRLIANFEDDTDTKLDFIEFTDKRKNPSIEDIWDNDKWWDGIINNNRESIALLDNEALPIVQQFLKQVLNKK